MKSRQSALNVEKSPMLANGTPTKPAGVRGYFRRVLKSGFLYVVPLILLLSATTLFPIAYVIYSSFFRNYLPEGELVFLGLENYREALAHPDFFLVLKNTFVYVFFSVVFHLGVAIMLAIFLDKRKGKLQSISRSVRSIITLPWLTSWAVAAAIWSLILDPSGVLNGILTSYFGVENPKSWFGDPAFAMFWIIFITVWKAFPFFLLLIFAAVNSVPTELYEAAEIDGAGYWNKFYHITLKSILPTVLALTILDIVWSIRQYDIMFLTTGGGPLKMTQTLTLEIYESAFVNLRFGMASAQGVILLMIASIFALAYIKFANATEHQS